MRSLTLNDGVLCRRPNPGNGTLHIYCLHEILIYKMVKKRVQCGWKGNEGGEWCVLMEDDYRMALSVVWSHGFL